MKASRIASLTFVVLMALAVRATAQSGPPPLPKPIDPVAPETLAPPLQVEPAGPEGSGVAPASVPEVAVDPCIYLFPSYGRFGINGWLQGGYLSTFDAPDSRFNGPYNWQDRDELPLNQAYLSFERKLDPGRRLSLGGRVDVLYGSDFLFAQSRGLETNPDGTPHWNGGRLYGVAIPQAYGEIGIGPVSVKLGHFYGLVGYESVMPTENFFYSHSYAFQFGQPFTHTGGLLTWTADEHLVFTAGLMNGWDAFDPSVDTLGFTGQIKVLAPSKNWAFAAAVASSKEPSGNQFLDVPGRDTVTGFVPFRKDPVAAPYVAGSIAFSGVYENRTVCTLTLEILHEGPWEFAFQQQFGVQENGKPAAFVEALWYGLSQYAYYEIQPGLKAGSRFEVFRDEDGTRVNGRRLGNPNDLGYPGTFYTWTLGLNWSPNANLMVRPELRYDTFTGRNQPYDDGASRNQFLVGLDAIVKF